MLARSLNHNERRRTRSTSLSTLRKFSPASFLRSSTDHVPVASSAAKSAGYLDTSSNPEGVLRTHDVEVHCIIQADHASRYSRVDTVVAGAQAHGVNAAHAPNMVHVRYNNNSEMTDPQA
jgi:hypothetical protein